MDHDPADQATPSPDRELIVLFGKALRLLGEAGRPVAASKLAGKAWWAATKAGDEAGAARINGVMHYLAKLPPEVDEEPPSARARPSSEPQPASGSQPAEDPQPARSTNG